MMGMVAARAHQIGRRKSDRQSQYQENQPKNLSLHWEDCKRILPRPLVGNYHRSPAIEVKNRVNVKSAGRMQEVRKILLRMMVRWQPIRSTRSSGILGPGGMSVNRNIRQGMFGTVWIATVPVLLLLSALLVVQNVPLRFPAAPSTRQCSIGAGSAQCQTQRFDLDGAQWIAPVVAIAILPSVARANLTFTQEPLPAIQMKGFHFNRPPPTD